MKRTLALLFLAVAPAFAQAPTPAATAPKPQVETAGEKEEKISPTSHAIRLDGRDIKYTATAGTMPIRLDDGQVAAGLERVPEPLHGHD